MSVHLLDVRVEWLATLPNGVLLDEGGRLDPVVRRMLARFQAPARLVLTDTVTAAVVAMRIVRLWSARAGVGEIAAIIGGTDEEAWSTWCEVMALAMGHDPMSPEQTETLARLAQAAMSSAPEATP